MIKKIALFILTIVFLMFFQGCQWNNNQKVLSAIQEAIPNDNFYFIRGLDRERSLATNIRYRGIVYSDKLKENRSMLGIQIAIEDLSRIWKRVESYERQYQNALDFSKAVEPVRIKAKEIFGDDIIIYNDLSQIWEYDVRIKSMNSGITTVGKSKEQTVIDVFVDDISKINEDDFKKKAFEFYRYMYDILNIESQMSINLRDRKYLTYEEVESRIFYLFKDEPKVKELLKEYKSNGTLAPSDMGYLMSLFTSSFHPGFNLPKIKLQPGSDDQSYKEIFVGNFKEVQED